MLPHRIHLKGPWEYEWLSDSSSVATSGETGSPSQAEPGSGPAPTGRVRMPAEWRALFGDRGGRVRFRRRFQRPTNLDASEQVFVVFDGIAGTGRILLNGKIIGEVEHDRHTAGFDVTTRLERTNELAIELEFAPEDTPDEPGGLWGPVVIEIRSESHRLTS